MAYLVRGTLVCERSAASGETVVDALHVADNGWSRLAGLQFRRSLPPGHGMLLTPCSSVHTFWMRYSIDVVFLNSEGEVLEVRRNVRPWRVARPQAAAHAVLELPGGSCRLAPGDRLRLVAAGEPPPSLAFLSSPQVDVHKAAIPDENKVNGWKR